MVRMISCAVGIWCLAAHIALPFERPVIVLLSPPGLNEAGEPTKYSHTANVLVVGEIKPPVGKQLKVSIYSVTGEGKLFRLTSADTPIRDGKFNINFDAPTGGWPVCPLRMEATLMDMKQVKTQVNVTVVPPDVAEIAKPMSPVENSGITLDLANSKGTIARVPAKTLFYLRGQFEQKDVESKLEGPGVSVHIAAAKSRIRTGYSASLRQAEDKPIFEYEIELEAPTRPGLYAVRVQPHIDIMWWKLIEGKEPDFMLEVTDLGK